MEEENKEVVEETTTKVTQGDPGDEHVDKPSPVSINEDGDYKVDLSIPLEPENETQDDNADDSGVVASTEDADATQEQEEVHEEAETQEAEELEEALEEVEPGEEVPENIQKLMDFMDETGGDINDYVKLNADISEMDDSEVLADYYKKTKPHLDGEEINFLLEDTYSYDEDVDDAKEVRKKKIALKEQVANAKEYLEGQKSKYYEDIKSGSKLTTEQQDAIEFFEKYNQDEQQELETVKNQQSTFLDKTNKVFDSKFKGFEFKVGDTNMEYNVSNVDEVKNKQIDINNFVGKFLNKDGVMKDAAGYHRALYTAMNPDAVAKHFYEQGKSDAIKQTVSDTKNINTSRSSHKVYEADGVKFKVLGDDSSSMKLRFKGRK
jgi:hypothetical protein|tara:strand:- start:176 stop:1309 length:1134 start_codon:yes stop_codon:yes gene_type:complete